MRNDEAIPSPANSINSPQGSPLHILVQRSIDLRNRVRDTDVLVNAVISNMLGSTSGLKKNAESVETRISKNSPSPYGGDFKIIFDEQEKVYFHLRELCERLNLLLHSPDEISKMYAEAQAASDHENSRKGDY